MFLDPSWWFSSSGTAQTPQGNDKNIFICVITLLQTSAGDL